MSESSDAGRTEHQQVVERLRKQGRSTLLLRPRLFRLLSAQQTEAVRRAMEETMVRVPAGPVRLEVAVRDEADEGAGGRIVECATFWLDRQAVTNAQYAQFVSSGGYADQRYWDESILDHLPALVDRTGHPGPCHWSHGRPPAGTARHPVAGVSWYEAMAYARWVGKRLPTDAEWVRGGTAPVVTSQGQLVQRRFPWGDAFEPERVNIWSSGRGTTVPVDALPAGASVWGTQQMIGNVWEWTADDAGAAVGLPYPLQQHTGRLKGLRGAAFDTYFELHASPHFASGDSVLARKPNIGFRCAVGADELVGCQEASA